MKKIVVFGATSIEMPDLLRDCIRAGANCGVVRIFDDNPEILGTSLEGRSLIGTGANPAWRLAPEGGA